MRRAECEFLTGALAEAESALSESSSRAISLPDLAAVTRLRVDLFMTLGQVNRAVDVGLDYLRRVGIDWSPHPTEDEARRDYEQVLVTCGSRPIEELIDSAPNDRSGRMRDSGCPDQIVHAGACSQT